MTSKRRQYAGDALVGTQFRGWRESVTILQLGLEDESIGRRSRLLSDGVAKEDELVVWLEQAFVGGVVCHDELLFIIR